jgi:hypothetical protein
MLTSSRADDGDDDEDTRPEPKKPIVAKPKKKRAKAKEKPADTDDAALAAARVARDIAKAKAQGTGTRVVALSEPRTPRLEMHGQHFSRSNERELLLASQGFNSEDEFEAHRKLAATIRDQAQAHPSTPMQRNLDAQGIPWRSSPESVATLRDAMRATALSDKRPEHPGFRSFRSARNGGPFDGGSGAAA